MRKPVVEGTMAEATQPVEQGEHLAVSTPPLPTSPRRTRRGRAALMGVILLLGGGVGMVAWQRLETHPKEVQPAAPAVSQPRDVAVVNEQQLQQLVIEP